MAEIAKVVRVTNQKEFFYINLGWNLVELKLALLQLGKNGVPERVDLFRYPLIRPGTPGIGLIKVWWFEAKTFRKEGYGYTG